MFRTLLLVILGLHCSLPASAFEIGPVSSLQIDGSGADWPEEAYRIRVLGAPEAELVPPADLDVTAALGWDASALYVLVEVRDDAVTVPREGRPDGDAVDLFLIGAPAGSAFLHVRLHGFSAPDALAVEIYGPGRTPLGTPPAVEAALRRTDGGYALEGRIPWPGSSGAPTWGFQCFVDDVDETGPRHRVTWYPATDTPANAASAFPLTLADKAGPPFVIWTHAAYDDLARVRVRSVGPAEQAGARVQASLADARSDVTLEERDGRAYREYFLPIPAPDSSSRTVVADAAGYSSTAPLPDAMEYRARKVMNLPLRFSPPVFASDVFPACDFENPLLAERLLGHYTISSEFHAADYAPVNSAAAPGRYGAIVTITPEQGRPLTRFRTLFRAPRKLDDFFWNFTPPEAASGAFPEQAYGLEPAGGAGHPAVARYTHDLLADQVTRDHDAAMLLAALYEQGQNGTAGTVENARTLDRQWWVGLKRGYYGVAEHAVDAPRRIDGPPAPELREGTETEAGMREGVAVALDTHLTQWSGDTNEAFAVAIARDGVLFYHQAFGTRNGAPMTLDTPSWMASITKFLSATLMMELVDRGLVNLDDEVARYVPALQGIEVATPLRIRDLYVHTNGLLLGIKLPGHYPDHWGDELHDLEEVIAGYYPHLQVRQAQGYNGVGYALGGKVMEMVSGESLPIFFRKHLLDPLGMAHTRAEDGSAMGKSTPRDMAVFGQMMLNGGAYGPWRFFEESTLEQMLPRPLRETTGINSDKEWGIGCTWFRDGGLSDQTFAHGAASAATLRIDPANKLVVVMTRNSAGDNYHTHFPRFMQIIAEHLPPTAP